ncbi:MAG: hypothetical protein IH589_18845 [Anaerolineales bacterium]|nr:hypothetical protein [Anaerolineales bacterium]
MFPPNNSPFEGLAKVILILVAIGILVGLVLTGSDITNFITNSAKAEAIKQQNELQAQKNAIDLEAYQLSVNQQLLAQQEQAVKELQFQEQKAAQELELARLSSYLWVGAGVFVAFCFGVGFVILMIQFGRSLLITSQAQVKKTDVWQNPVWRKQQIEISRQLERAQREDFGHLNEAPIPWDGLRQQYHEAKKS